MANQEAPVVALHLGPDTPPLEVEQVNQQTITHQQQRPQPMERQRSMSECLSEDAFSALSFGQTSLVRRAISMDVLQPTAKVGLPSSSLKPISPGDSETEVLSDSDDEQNDDEQNDEEDESSDAEVTNDEEGDIGKPMNADLDVDTWGSWVTRVCVVGFDLEKGQSLEQMFPLQTPRLVDEDIKNIAFLSFPDSSTGCTGDTQFSFRIRSFTDSLPKFSKTSHRKRYLFGSVFFRQVPDPTNRRGFYQKSVVVLTEHPWAGLYAKLDKIIALAFYNRGPGAIEAACADMSKWPDPTPGTTLDLHLLGIRFRVNVPMDARSIQYSRVDGGRLDRSMLVASPFHMNLFRHLKVLLSHLQLLWELMITAEPIVVRGPTPAVTSSTVLALVSLTAPLQYTGDFRPYFTIHDSDCSTYVKESSRFPCAILGVTNPYFDKALSQWPTTIRITHQVRKGDQQLLRKIASHPRMNSLSSSVQSTTTSTAAAAATMRRPKLGSPAVNGKSHQKRAGVQSKCRQVLEHDRRFLKDLLDSSKQSSSEVSTAIRSHFWSLTQQFTTPLESYFARLMPLKASISPFDPLPTLGVFDRVAFLDTVKNMGGLMSDRRIRRGKWVLLYKRFLNSANFRGWFAEKTESADAEIIRIYLNKVCVADFRKWAETKNELEVIDMFMRLKKCLVLGEEMDAVGTHILARGWEKMKELTLSMPDDMRSSIAISPMRPKVKRRRSVGRSKSAPH